MDGALASVSALDIRKIVVLVISCCVDRRLHSMHVWTHRFLFVQTDLLSTLVVADSSVSLGGGLFRDEVHLVAAVLGRAHRVSH